MFPPKVTRTHTPGAAKSHLRAVAWRGRQGVDNAAEVRQNYRVFELARPHAQRTAEASVAHAHRTLPPAQTTYSDEKVANRDTRVWHGATGNGT
jgi:hypothetical protein